MCFSASASFTAACFLGGIGYFTLKESRPRERLLASIPSLFAVQQFSEGILWLELGHQIPHPNLFFLAQSFFLIFAFLFWPIWIPLSLIRLETISWRFYAIAGTFICGVLLAGWNLSYAFHQEVSVQFVNHSIQYQGDIPSQRLLYPFIVIFPCLISSYPRIWIFGVLVGVSYLIANYYYMTTFVSVWCFFAAIASVALYIIIKKSD